VGRGMITMKEDEKIDNVQIPTESHIVLERVVL